MAAAAGKTSTGAKSTPDLEADIRQLKADIEELTRHLTETGQHGYRAARSAASQGADQMRVQGEAAYETLRHGARDLEDQFLASVREKPVTSLAIAAGVGFLVALLARR
ncbi:DUF883 family protein [Aminobacter sp. HY435]|uniref:DUF883 family protein n=1 Tax=Aminobacter sp. HY435 TaxID=2970917 RepID=UPI0022B9606F|nr:hypothetical protein [Aminobacter sp. HY435]